MDISILLGNLQNLSFGVLSQFSRSAYEITDQPGIRVLNSGGISSFILGFHDVVHVFISKIC